MNKRFKRARAFVLDNWYVGLIVAIGSGIVLALLLIQLGSLVGGLSESEYQLQQQLRGNELSFTEIIRDPLFLPYSLGLYIAQLLPFSGPTTIRSVGALFGLLGAFGFFYILNKWYSLRMAIFGTALFTTSSWFLHTARYASPDASYLLLPLLVAGVIALQAKKRSKWTQLLLIIFGFMALYIPGLVWFIVPAVILQRRVIIQSLKLQRMWFNIIAGLVCLLMLTPLVYAMTTASSLSQLVLGLLGLPNTFPNVVDTLKNFAQALSDIFIYSNLGTLYVPGHLPWLDVGTVALVILGAVQFAKHRKLDRSKLFIIVITIGLLLVALGGPVSLVILLPFIYLLAVEGVRWLLEAWLRVFPKNPIARSFGIVAVAAIVVCAGVYQTNKYFLAWGQSPDTQAQFNKLP
jgi:hypothetical protein